MGIATLDPSYATMPRRLSTCFALRKRALDYPHERNRRPPIPRAVPDLRRSAGGGEAAQAAPRVAALRAELARRGLDGFVVPHADRHQNEYLPPSEERLAWLTGFTGSAGAAIILADRAALFVDGRYTTQARDQVDGALFSIEHIVDAPPSAWIEANLTAGQKLGYDAWLHSAEGAERLAKACASVGAILVATEPNPIDAIWRGPPGAAPRRGGAA